MPNLFWIKAVILARSQLDIVIRCGFQMFPCVMLYIISVKIGTNIDSWLKCSSSGPLDIFYIAI